jgi:hypothetical protein
MIREWLIDAAYLKVQDNCGMSVIIACFIFSSPCSISSIRGYFQPYRPVIQTDPAAPYRHAPCMDDDLYKLMLAWIPAYQADPGAALMIRLEYMSGRISLEQAIGVLRVLVTIKHNAEPFNCF